MNQSAPSSRRRSISWALVLSSCKRMVRDLGVKGEEIAGLEGVRDGVEGDVDVDVLAEVDGDDAKGIFDNWELAEVELEGGHQSFTARG